MLVVARARVQANGNNVIVLINRDTASVLCGRRRRLELEPVVYKSANPRRRTLAIRMRYMRTRYVLRMVSML